MVTTKRISLNETDISIAVNQPDTMVQTTMVLKDYLKEHFPGADTFSMIGHPETLSLILPELVFTDIDKFAMKTSLLSFVNDEGVEVMVKVVSYINFKAGKLHIDPSFVDGRVYDYTPVKYSIYDYSEYRKDELFKMERVINPTTKEDLVATIQMLIFTHGLEQENAGLLVVGHPAKFVKLFPGAEFISVQGLLYKFMITTIERIRINCIAYDACDESDLLRIVIFKRY